MKNFLFAGRIRRWPFFFAGMVLALVDGALGSEVFLEIYFSSSAVQGAFDSMFKYGVIAPDAGASIFAAWGIVFVLPFMAPLFCYQTVLYAKRMRDMEISGWVALSVVSAIYAIEIPFWIFNTDYAGQWGPGKLIHIPCHLILLFSKGTEGENKYGPTPEEQT